MPVEKGHRWCAKLIAWQISLTGKKKKKENPGGAAMQHESAAGSPAD